MQNCLRASKAVSFTCPYQFLLQTNAKWPWSLQGSFLYISQLIRIKKQCKIALELPKQFPLQFIMKPYSEKCDIALEPPLQFDIDFLGDS